MDHHQSWIDDVIAACPPLLTSAEACEVLRCSRRELYRRISRGQIRTVAATASGPSRRLIPRMALGEYLRGLTEAA